MGRIESAVARHEAGDDNALSHAILVDLRDHGMPSKYEELLGTPVPGGYRIASIPWFAYGVAKHDIVETRHSSDTLVYVRTVAKSGHRTLRFGIRDHEVAEELHEPLHALLASSGLDYEWHASGYAAIDLPQEGSEEPLVGEFRRLADAGEIEFEVQ